MIAPRLFALSLLAAGASPALGVVVYDAGTLSDVPNPTWYARFDADGTAPVAGNASSVVVGTNQIITTKHQTNGNPSPSAIFEIPSGANAGIYKTVSETPVPNVDLRVFTVSKLDGSPANFSTFANVFTGPLLTYNVVIGGYGRQISTPLAGGTGLNVTSSPNNNTYDLLQGQNRIYGTATDPTYTFGHATHFILADFDGPTEPGIDGVGKLPFEANVAEFDSGGGWFVKADGMWQLIGVTVGTDTPNTADYGDRLFAAYVTPFAALVPEPALGLLAALPALALQRRRRSR